MNEGQMIQFYERRGTYPECGEGWYQLILDLDGKISSIEPGYRVDQVKEKFGGLRFYYDQININDDDNRERVDKLVDAAEEKSFTICEVCGVSDSTVITSGHWVKTLCADHRDK